MVLAERDSGLTPRQLYNARFSDLKRERAPWDSTYEELGNYLLPWRIRFNESERGRRANDAIYDPTGTLSVRTCVAGMAAGFCSQARTWFRYGPPAALLATDRRLAQKPSIKRYLADAEDVVRDILRRSNFYAAISGAILPDLVTFGTAGMVIEEDWRNVANFKPFPIGQYWLAADARGEVNTFYRRFTYTVAQLEQDFGLEACSPIVREQFRRHQLDTRHRVMHVVEPNVRDQGLGFEGQRSGRFDWRGMEFRSVWYECSNDQDRRTGFLRVRGFRQFPGVFPRWARTSAEDVYGTGAGHEALPDVKQLQTAVKRKLQMIEKQAQPALKGSAEIIGYPSQLPGNFVPVPAGGSAADELKPIHVPDHGAVEQVRLDAQELRYAVRQALFADLWRLITDDQRSQPGTAEEIRAKREERLLQLGPVATTFETECLRRALDRVFYLADERGMLPEPPEELADQEVKTEFLSVFGEAQKAQEIPAVERVAAFVKALAELDEEVLDTLDADKFAEKYAEIAGLPPDLLRSPEARKALREARQAKTAAAETGQALGAMAQGAKDLAGASLEDDNALSRIVGGLGPVAATQAGALA